MVLAVIAQDVQIETRKQSVAPNRRETISSKSTDVVYGLEDVPPWYLSIILGIQHYLTMFSGAIAVPFLISTKLCMDEDSASRGQIITTTLFVSGIATFIQATFGSRLPIIQGPSLSFLIPTLAILSLPQWQCPSLAEKRNMTEVEKEEVWMSRMREVQGAIIVASSVEILIGVTGFIGFLMRYITPLAIAPTITLIGLSLFKEAALRASGHWGISILTIALLVGFSQYMSNVNLPRCGYNKEKGLHVKMFPFFKLFPVMVTILISWGLCGILTATDVFAVDSEARTDLKLSGLNNSAWIELPYPGQWGMPTFNVGPALGVIAGVLASTIESVGDYYACARLAGAPAPPIHAVNRGIAAEGLGSLLAGFFGTGSGLTSFSQNIGAIGITKVGSRRVIQFAAIIIILFGMLGKFGMLFIAIPSPIMGGTFCVMFSIISGVGLSNLQFVDLNSSRNLFVMGFSLFMGLCLPSYFEQHEDIIKTGVDVLDQIFVILLKTSMFIGGFFGCLLDNTIPASEDVRGVTRWRAETMSDGADLEQVERSYNFPFGMKLLKKFKCFQYIPISPTYDSSKISLGWLIRKPRQDTHRKYDIKNLQFTATSVL